MTPGPRDPEPFQSASGDFSPLPPPGTCSPRPVTERDACGLPTRGLDDASTDATGTRALIPSQASQLPETRGTTFEAVLARDLSGFGGKHWRLDAVVEPMRRTGRIRDGVLAAWGIGRDGQRVWRPLALGNTESACSEKAAMVAGRPA